MITIHGPAVLDLNTQRDLLTSEGAYPLFQADKLIDPLKKLFTWAQRQKIPVVSTRLRGITVTDSRGVTRLVCHPHTSGYQKVSATQMRRRQEMPLDCGTDLPVEGFRVWQQMIFDLPSLNPFECPRLDRLLSESQVGLWLIVGGPLEACVRTAVLGLLQRRQKVAVVSDCVGQWDPYEGNMALRQIESKNIEWFTSEQVAERYGTPKPVQRPAAAASGATPRKTRPAVPARPAAKTPPRNAGKVTARQFKMT